MKQQELLDTHIFLTTEGLNGIVKFFMPLRIWFEAGIERNRSLGNLPPALHALTDHAETNFVTLGGLLPRTNPTSFHPTIPDGRETAARPVTVPTPLESYANTSDSDIDADGESEVDELMDDGELYADGDSEMDESTDDEFFAAAADASGYQSGEEETDSDA
jgi:hypothetical protein